MGNSNLKYRDCVGIMLINPKGLVWIGKRVSNNPSNSNLPQWQMPQGGIDKGEDPFDAAKRELFEETSVSKISLIAETENWLSYEIPDELKPSNAWGEKYQGQRQKWFAFRFDGKDSEVNISNPPDGHKPEFIEWRWEKASQLSELVIPFKRDVYKQVVEYFSKYCAG